MSEKW